MSLFWYSCSYFVAVPCISDCFQYCLLKITSYRPSTSVLFCGGPCFACFSLVHCCFLPYLQLCEFCPCNGYSFIDISDFSFQRWFHYHLVCFLHQRCLHKDVLIAPRYITFCKYNIVLPTCVNLPSSKLMLHRTTLIQLFWSRRGTTMKETCSLTISPSWKMCGCISLKLQSLSNMNLAMVIQHTQSLYSRPHTFWSSIPYSPQYGCMSSLLLFGGIPWGPFHWISHILHPGFSIWICLWSIG